MSFRQKAIILGSIFVVLLIVFVLGSTFSPSVTSKRRTEAPLVSGLIESAVKRVELKESAAQVQLDRTEAGWTVTIDGKPFPAADTRIAELLKALASLPRGTLVTRNAAGAANLGLDEQSAKRIILTGSKGEVLYDLTVGKSGVGQRGYYVTAGGKPEVYQTGDSLSSYLSTSAQYWSNLRVLPADLNAEDITRFGISSSISYSDGGMKSETIDYFVTRQKDAEGSFSWTFGGLEVLTPGGVKTDQPKAEQLVSSLLSLEGTDFLTDPNKGSLSSPIATVTIAFSNDKSYGVIFGPENDADQYPCSLANGAVQYLVPAWRVEAILLPKESLIASGS